MKGRKSVDIGEKIKTARQAKGMTQEELGEILGVQKSAIAKYENGRVVNIKRSTLKKISDVLEIPPFELIFDEEHRKIQKKNDTLTDVVVRMRTDNAFLSVVEGLNRLKPEQLAIVKQFVDSFPKE
jgi:transcriptional regulator with XRE-family HTH domain